MRFAAVAAVLFEPGGIFPLKEEERTTFFSCEHRFALLPTGFGFVCEI